MSGTLLAVRDYMSSPVHTIGEAVQLSEIDRRLDELDVSALLVVGGDGEPVGVVSRTDLLRVGRVHPGEVGRSYSVSFPQQPVSAVMRPGVVTVSSDARLAAAAQIMVQRHIHRVFVMEDSRMVGVVSTTDVTEALTDTRCSLPLSELMSSSIVTVSTDATVQHAIDRMTEAHIHAVVVVEDNWPIGVFGQLDALAAKHADPDDAVENYMDFAVLCLPMRMPSHRAAAHALAMGVEQVLAMDESGVQGVLTGIDFARALV